MPSKSSLFHVVGRLVAVDRNLGGGWLPRGRPHRTEHLELTAPLGGLTADRPPPDNSQKPVAAGAVSVGRCSLLESVCVSPAKIPAAVRPRDLVLGDGREGNDACCEFDGPAGEGEGRDNQIPGWIPPSTEPQQDEQDEFVTRHPSTAFAAVVLRLANKISSRLLLFGAPPFSFPGSRQPASPIVWGAPTVGGDGQVFYIRSHNFVKPSGMESISSPHRTSAKPMANEHQDPSSYSLCFGGEHSGRTARRGFCCRR